MHMNSYEFASGTVNGGVAMDGPMDGLGKQFWKKKQFKRKTKGLRKVALIAGTGAALYFGGTAIAAALAKRKAAAAASAGADFITPNEGPDTTGYAGADAAISPTAPSPDYLDTGLRLASKAGTLTASVRPNSPSTRSFAQTSETQGVTASGFMNTKNIMLIGGAAALALALFMMKKGRK